MENYRLHIKIGNAEFEAEGPESTVKAQFEEFKQLIEQTPPAISNVVTSASAPTITALQPAVEVGSDRLKSLFLNSKGGNQLSLYVTLQGAERVQKALLLLLYGYKRLLGKDDVAVTTLKDSLEQSGFFVGRVDRATSPLIREALVVKAGKMGKGGRYRLTNLGAARAEAEAKQLLQQVG